MSGSVDDLLVAVAAVGLPGSLCELPQRELPEREARALVDAVARHEIAGVALASAQAGQLRLARPGLKALADVHVREMAGCLHTEHALLSAITVLDEQSIETRVLDGIATAHLDYHDPAWRSFRDPDVLVRSSDLRRAHDALERSGWRPPRRLRDDAWRGATLVGPAGVHLTLHTSIECQPDHRAVEGPELWADAQAFSVGQHVLKALGPEQRLLHACCRAASAATPPLVVQRDVAEMVLFGDVDYARLMELAISWQAQAAMAHAIRAAWNRLSIADVTSLSVWAEKYLASRSGSKPRRETTAARAAAAAARPLRGIREIQAGRA
jgi:hypothetical protein